MMTLQEELRSPRQFMEKHGLTALFNVATRAADAIPPDGRKPLTVLVACYPAGMTEVQWSLIAGYKHTGGTWKEYRQRLVRAELVERNGDLWMATPTGVATIGDDYEAPPLPGPDLARWWASKIPGTPKLTEALIQAWPFDSSPESLAAAIGMQASGGSFKEYVGRLVRNKVATRGPQGIRLTKEVMGAA